MSADCPSPDVLHHFRRGELDETAASEVRAHLEVCAACRDALGGDPNIERLGAGDPPGGAGALSTEPFDSKADAPDHPVMSSLDPDEPSDPRISFVEGQVVFGHFEIVRLLSSGGMGRVYLVRDQRIDNAPRALKMILRSRFNDLNLKRFRREARVMARLNHPNIVNLVHFDFQDILRPYIVMEFVEGQSLDKVLRGGVPMRLDWTARILEQLCDVLEITHQQDPPIIHRDLKPSNLMLLSGRKDGREFLKVLDFGLAKEIPAGGSLFQSIDLGLTPAYASPEQCDRTPQDPRSDLYTVGVILYEMLTGYRPFEGTIYELCHKHIVELPPAFAVRNPEAQVPAEVEALVLRCLEKDPALRPQTARELRDAYLDAIQRTVVVEPARAGTTSARAGTTFTRSTTKETFPDQARPRPGVGHPAPCVPEPLVGEAGAGCLPVDPRRYSCTARERSAVPAVFPDQPPEHSRETGSPTPGSDRGDQPDLEGLGLGRADADRPGEDPLPGQTSARRAGMRARTRSSATRRWRAPARSTGLT